MISYAPLAMTLKERGKDFGWLEDSLGMERGDLKWRMNEGRYISMRTLDSICGALGCGVSDVVEWKDGVQSVRRIGKFTEVDWERFRADAGDLYKAAERIGRSRTYLVMMAKRERVGRSLFRGVCAGLGLDAGRYMEG